MKLVMIPSQSERDNQMALPGCGTAAVIVGLMACST
jgi:hypothetical protein